ncbi:myosin-like protein [Fusarium avenaceum]|nr:myosin-like protein [Fusarium avenaceum]
MAAADVDIAYVAGHLGLDQPVIASLTTEPTVDLVNIILKAVAAKAHEFDTLYAEKLQTDIELENAVRSSETRSQTFKATADKALKDVEEARQLLQDEETKRQSVENELQVLKAKKSDYDAEIKALNDKIETLHSSNRTNLSIIESNNKRDQTVTEELTKQHQRNVELSREITALQQSEQNARGQLNSAKYREESLQQQLDLARKNSEWLENELKTKSEEGLKYRKEKGARIAELQRQNEDIQSQMDTMKRTEQQLRDRLTAMQARADEALVKVQNQEGSYASTIESYKHELESQKRLAEMSDSLGKKHQERVRDLEAEKERLRDNYENELRRVRSELEQERENNVQMEEKINQLQAEIDELQVRMEQQAPPPESAPQTPRANGALMRPSSPFATPGSIRGKGAITATQALDQLYQVKGQLATERRRNQQLSEELDSMMSALEAKAPEMQELQSEAETLREEITRMSELSQQSFEERDTARRAARKAEGALATAQSETNILRTQLRDLGTQINMLLFQIHAMEKGMDQLTEEETFRLQQLQKGEISEEALSDMSDTHQFITQKLVVFKDIQSLQAKNEELLRITRELADQLESEEALAEKHQAKQDHDMVEKLQQELEHMVEETRSIKKTMESYKTERDMFRRLLQQRGVHGDEASMMRNSIAGGERLPLASIEATEQTETLNEALRKLQSEYDNYRDAQDGVRKDMRDQLDALSAERNALQTDKVKLHGEVRLESERREMLNNNYVALQNENHELQKRSQILSETAAKQDIRTQQVAEELIEAKGLLDSVRNETANLKAEKKLWKDIQDRLSRDNENLIEEKNRLNNLLATQQSIENERNMADSESRRKAQAKIESLEQELSDAQRKLNYEAEETKKLQLRKEYESKESQKRIDELMTSLSQIREEHVAVKTSRDHLQARVDELTVEVRNAEERAGRLQPRPTPRPGTIEVSEQQQQMENEIQELNVEISDLKRDLDMANTHLENAKTQAEQFRELSQANEEALEDLRGSQEQYQQEMEALIEEKDAKIKELGQRAEDLSAELSRSNTELSSLRDSQGEVARRYEDEKTILQEEVNRLKEESARHLEATRYHQQDLRAQAEIASKAQQDYEQELVKHAEAAKLVQQLRAEHNALKSEAASLKSEADSAKVTLAQSESSWEDRRQQLEQEMAELKTRREDVNSQNKILHQQLEGLTAQVAALQQKRGDQDDEDERMSPVPVGDATEGLRELNSYLRREKEILEVQYDLKAQESKRLQQQLEYTQTQLDEARLKLDQERTQTAQSGRTSMTHQDLMEKLNELNIYRESSMTLRNENQQLKDQIGEKNKKIEEMEARIHPLEAEIDTLKTQKSFLEDEIKQIQEDRDRWQKRTEGILTKYGRVDPAEMEQLKEKITELESERDTLKQGEEPLKAKLTELETSMETERSNWSATREKNEALQRVNQVQESLDKANAELEGVKKENFQKEVEQLRQQAQTAQSAPTPAQPADVSASSEVVTQLEQQLADARRELDAINGQKQGAEQQLESLHTELQTAISERDEVAKKLQEATEAAAQAAEVAPKAAPQTTEQAPAVSATGEATEVPSGGVSDEEKKALEQKIAAAEAKAAEYEQKANEESRHRMEEEFKKKDEDLKLKFEQEKQIWLAENPTAKPNAAAPKTEPTDQPPSTPAKAESSGVPPTPASVGPSDLSHLDDAGIRQFLATNPTVKNIVAANIKKKLEVESSKLKTELETNLKTEYETKISSARDQAQLMESKKSTLRINMAENKLRAAAAKINVVEKAASETPQKPVVEVWEVAKIAQAPPPTPAAAKPAPARQGSVAGVPPSPSPATPATASAPTEAKPAQASGPAASGIPGAKNNNNNPFAVPANPTTAAAPNPFAAKSEGGATPATKEGQPQAQAPQQQQAQPQGQGQAQPQGQAQNQQPVRQRAASGTQEGAHGHAGRGGRGGRGGGRGGMNPGANDFQPGNKRPRGDSEVGGGAKRARGAH